ncbi:MAG: hypothetical protein CBB68_01160 [Rhodospirillaceae bacterium TMED8]|nr:hypothetical protein [Magnetovibrio sp.]OUT53164.1 MAG: hypothetical protein CBB68_01160 [Rhodospirillaceae bacterium TMED8]
MPFASNPNGRIGKCEIGVCCVHHIVVVEDLLSERGIDICRETVRFWCNRFGPMFAAKTSVG